MKLRSRPSVWILACVLSIGLASTGCYRTRYVQFSPADPTRSAEESVTKTGPTWKSFFLWGWVPGELRVDAQDACGGTEQVDSIETRRTFVQGLVAAVAGFYVNIYSPYDGAVYCRPER